MFEIIARINQAGTTVLLAEQNAYAALNIASRAYVQSIATAYVDERFGRRKLKVADQLQLEQAWSEVRKRLLRRMSNAREVWTRARSGAQWRQH